MIEDIVVEEEAKAPVDKEKRLFSLRQKKEPNYTGDPGRNLFAEIQQLREQQVKLTRAIQKLCTILEEPLAKV
jgi:hypothetical protein